MTFPSGGTAIVRALYDRNLALARGSDDDRRALTRLMVETLAARIDPRFGLKKAGPNNPPSKDTLAYDLGDGAFAAFDWQNGTTKAVQISDGQAPTYARIADQVFIRVTPLDHLADVAAPPTPTPTPTPSPGEDLVGALIAAVGELATAVAQQHGQIATLTLEVEQLAAVQARGLKGTIFGVALTLTPPPAK